ILCGYKGLVLFFGLFLSYETRSAKLKQINDSRLVAMSIYNVVILCLITGPVSLVIDNQVNSHFAFIGLTIIFCCILSMALIFLPKIIAIVQHQQNLGQGLNNTFNETMTTKEEEERFVRLNSENDELKSKISEKERQIDEVKRKIEQLSREQMERKRMEEKNNSNNKSQIKSSILKKAVRIQEPDDMIMDDHQIATTTTTNDIDMTSDSGIQTSTAKTTSKLSENDFSESYL
ncbi:hypothetical protein BLA29_009766, partial [Euroglyphus maynei]